MPLFVPEKPMRRLLPLLVLVPRFAAAVAADPRRQPATANKVASTDWPRWRGPNADNVADNRNLPSVSLTENVLWSVKLPVGEPVRRLYTASEFFVTSQVEAGARSRCCCSASIAKMARSSVGTILAWASISGRTRNRIWRSTPPRHGRCGVRGLMAMPICALLHEGNLAWIRRYLNDFGDPKMAWGYAVSPLVLDDSVLFPWDHHTGRAF